MPGLDAPTGAGAPGWPVGGTGTTLRPVRPVAHQVLAFLVVVMQAYLRGVSTRKVNDLVKSLGTDTGIAKPW